MSGMIVQMGGDLANPCISGPCRVALPSIIAEIEIKKCCKVERKLQKHQEMDGYNQGHGVKTIVLTHDCSDALRFLA